MTEEWKAIPGTNGYYEVSSLGRVRSLMCDRTRVMKLVQKPNGVFKVNIRPPGKPQRSIQVNRLVLEAFRGPPGYREIAYHEDGDKKNNRLGNLAWISESYQKRLTHRAFPFLISESN